jgi:hypothetical protein
MTIWSHSTILVTTIAVSLAVGVAGVAIDRDADEAMATKGDRLGTTAHSAPVYLTVERRQPGVSVLIREFMGGPNGSQPH